MSPHEAHLGHFCYDIEVDIFDRTTGHITSDIALCVLDLILMLVAIVANTLAIIAYRRNVVLQTPSNYLLMILSFVDILLACTAQPLFLIWKILELTANFSCVVYLATVLLINFLGAVSFLVTSFLISTERYCSVFYPLHHRKNANKHFFSLAVFWVVVLWLAFLLLAFFGKFHRVYFGVAMGVVILCLVGTALGYARLFHEMSRRCSHREVSVESITDERRYLGQFTREKATLVNMIFIVSTMTLLYAPIGGCGIYAIVIGRDWLYMNYFVPWAYLLVFASNAFNPFLYGWKSRGMKQSIKGVIRNVFKETEV